MKKLDDLLVWRKTLVLITDTYEFINLLPTLEERNLKDQLRRAVVSVGLNIAEGCSANNDKEFIRFLKIAKNSAVEVTAIFIICNNLYKINCISLMNQTEEVIKMINGLVYFLKK